MDNVLMVNLLIVVMDYGVMKQLNHVYNFKIWMYLGMLIRRCGLRIEF